MMGMPNRAKMRPRRSGGVSRKSTAMPMGMSMPPPSPWSTRAAISVSALIAIPHRAEPRLNSTSEMR